jgi:hypothetical protein
MTLCYLLEFSMASMAFMSGDLVGLLAEEWTGGLAYSVWGRCPVPLGLLDELPLLGTDRDGLRSGIPASASVGVH